jgi:hypothetical protein
MKIEVKDENQDPFKFFENYSTDFCDIVFEIQIALARAFPCNDKVEYELLLLLEGKEKNPHTLPETVILLKKETERIFAIVPALSLQNNAEEKEEKQLIKRIPLSLTPGEQKLISDSKKESMPLLLRSRRESEPAACHSRQLRKDIEQPLIGREIKAKGLPYRSSY